MANNNDANAQVINRMKSLMNYGRITESKAPAYSSIEYSKVAADDKLYGIIREGAKYYIKVAKDAKRGLVTENFEYIGGFQNRQKHQFDSFASAQKFFGEKMSCINESVEDSSKRVIAECWNIDASKELIEEGTRKMQQEIARQRQIMMNVERINECKGQDCVNNLTAIKDQKEAAKENDKNAEYSKRTKAEKASEKVANITNTGNPNTPFINKVNEASETPLTSRENPEYIDQSAGTEIGKNAPFNQNVEDVDNAVATKDGGESVNEGVSLHSTDNQNSPAVGTGEKGDNTPFTDTVSEEEDGDIPLEESIDDVDEPLEDDADIELDGEDDDIDLNDEDGDIELDDDEDGADIELELDDDFEGEEDDENLASRVDMLDSKLDSIISMLNNMQFNEDEDLYDEEGDEEEDDEEEDEEDAQVFESRSYRNMRKLHEDENKMNYFSKHPAWRKKVMTLPQTDAPVNDGYYDINDDSVESEQPYASQLGDTAPFNQKIQDIENAITENVMNILKKNL